MSVVFHRAVGEGDVTKVRFLLKYSPSLRVDSVNRFGLTSLQQAAWDGNVDMVNFLLEQGADLSCVDTEGRTALHLASQKGHLGVVSLLVTSACANLNIKTKRGEQAIDLATNDQVRALLSQTMLTESFKRKCALDTVEIDTNGYKNTPGCRNSFSLSTASSDSGVYDDSCSSQESNSDPKYNRPNHIRVANRRGYHNKSSYSTISEDSGLCTDYSTSLHDRHIARLRHTRERRVDGSPVTSILKSQSFSGRHETQGEETSQEDTSPRENGIKSARPDVYRYIRPEKAYVRDAARRRTVTFGDMEKEREKARTVTYNGSYTDEIPSHESPKNYQTRNKPPPVPPRISPRNSPRSSSVKTRSELESESVYRSPRRPRSEMQMQDRRSMFEGYLSKGM